MTTNTPHGQKIPIVIACLIFLNFSPAAAQELWPYWNETTGKWGYGTFNEEGEEEIVIECKYDHAADFIYEDGIARIKLDNKYAYIDKTGKVVTDWFDEAAMMVEEKDLVKLNNKFNVILRDGRLVYKVWYDHIFSSFDGSLSFYGGLPDIVYCDNAWRFAKHNGKLFKGLYRDVYGWNNYELMVKQNGRWICLDANLSEINKDFKDVYDYSYGLSPQNKFGKFGYIDDQGEVAIPFQYDDADHFSEGLARVGKLDGINPWNESPDFIYGFINTMGNLVIDYQFSSASGFENGVAEVRKDGETYCIDKNGNKTECPVVEVERLELPEPDLLN